MDFGFTFQDVGSSLFDFGYDDEEDSKDLVKAIIGQPFPNYYSPEPVDMEEMPQRKRKRRESPPMADMFLSYAPATTGSFRFDVVIEKQPPHAVRKRTPQENRTFGVTACIPEASRLGIIKVRAMLAYNDEPTFVQNQAILGGEKVVHVQAATGQARFEKLCMCEASTKHNEREFVLLFVAIFANGSEKLCHTRSSAFYVYSNKKVLTRRQNIVLRALSKSWGDVVGGELMHVVGKPFIASSSLRCMFRTDMGDVEVATPSLFSDTVLEFVLPPLPVAEGLPVGTEISAQFTVSNDGRHWAEALPFTFVAGCSKMPLGMLDHG